MNLDGIETILLYCDKFLNYYPLILDLGIKLYLDNRVNVLGKSVLYVDGKPYSAVLISPVTQLRQNEHADSREYIILNEAIFGLYSRYASFGRFGIYASPRIDTPQPDRNEIPPDMIRIPDNPEKGRVPLRTPWKPDRLPIKRPPKKKRIH